MMTYSTLLGVLFLLWLKSTLAILRNDVFPEHPGRSRNGRSRAVNLPNIPTIPESGDLTFEVIPPKGISTILVREVHDSVDQRYFVSSESSKTVNINLLDLKQNIWHSINQNKLSKRTRCMISKAGNNTKNLLHMGFTPPLPSKTMKDIFSLAVNSNASWSGTEMVRGIPCNCWITRIKNVAYNALIKACFTTKNVGSHSSESQVPVKLELSSKLEDAWQNCTVNALSYKPGVPVDRTIFQPEVGTYCINKGSMKNRQAPRLPDMFEFSSEVVFSDSTIILPWTEKISFNKKANVIRVVKSFRQGTKMEQLPIGCRNSQRGNLESSMSTLKEFGSLEKQQSVPLSTPNRETSGDHKTTFSLNKDIVAVDDFALGIRYTMDATTETCNITKSQKTWSNLSLENPVKLIADKNKQLIYQGKKLFRKMPVHSWAYLDQNSIVHEVLFYMPPFTSEAKLVGISVYSVKPSASYLLPKRCLERSSSTFKQSDSKATNAGSASLRVTNSIPMSPQRHISFPTPSTVTSNRSKRNPILKGPPLISGKGENLNGPRPVPTAFFRNGQRPEVSNKSPTFKGSGRENRPNPAKPISGETRIPSPSFFHDVLDLLSQESRVFVNIYNFDDTEPDLSAFDVSKCFERGHRYRDMKMKLHPAKYENLLKGGKTAVIISLHEHIRTAAKVQPTRISKMELYEERGKDHVIVKFRLLALPVLTDGTKISLKIGPSLQGAYRNLVASTMSGLPFVLKPGSSAMVLTLYTDETESSQRIRQKSDTEEVAKGSVVGIGLAVLVVGFVLGGGLTMFVSRFKRRSNPYLVSG